NFVDYNYMPVLAALLCVLMISVSLAAAPTRFINLLLLLGIGAYGFSAERRARQEVLASEQPLRAALHPGDQVLLVSSIPTRLCNDPQFVCVGPQTFWFYLAQLGRY